MLPVHESRRAVNTVVRVLLPGAVDLLTSRMQIIWEKMRTREPCTWGLGISLCNTPLLPLFLTSR